MATSLFIWAWTSVGISTFCYLFFGAIRDRRRSLTAKRTTRVLPELSILLFDSNDQAAIAFESLVSTNRRVLLDVAQSLALDVNGEARERLQQLTRSTGLERSIRRKSRSRRWRNRVQAAQLHYLVTHPDFNRTPLLTDTHPLVRARAAETLTSEQAVTYVRELAALIGDDSLAVRMAVRDALLRAGAAAVEPLLRILNGDGGYVAEAMSVAANLPDPRLVAALTVYSNSPDPHLREMTMRALGSGSGVGSIQLLRGRLQDLDESVRAEAIVGLQRLEARETVAAIGAMLSDRSWKVRRAAGYALDQLGAPGQLILRGGSLEAEDPYARDMARQVLDGSVALSARTRLDRDLVSIL